MTPSTHTCAATCMKTCTQKDSMFGMFSKNTSMNKIKYGKTVYFMWNKSKHTMQGNKPGQMCFRVACVRAMYKDLKAKKEQTTGMGYPWERQRAWGWKTWSSQRRPVQCLSLCMFHCTRTHTEVSIYLFNKHVRMVVGVKLSEIYWSLLTASLQLPGFQAKGFLLLWYWSVSTASVILLVIKDTNSTHHALTGNSQALTTLQLVTHSPPPPAAATAAALQDRFYCSSYFTELKETKKREPVNFSKPLY